MRCGYDAHVIRDMERESIRRFVESCAEHFAGEHVLDFGCGRQPYRGIVEAAGGVYHGYDSPDFPASVVTEATELMTAAWPTGPGGWRRIICNQVLQYVPYPHQLMVEMCRSLSPGGVLVMTYPTSWEDFEEHDFWRWTKRGMDRLLVDAGFVIERHEARAQVELDGYAFRLGYGVVARA